MFIVIDGPSGTGKDSLIQNMVFRLQSRRLNYYSFSEEEVDSKRGEILEAKLKGMMGGGTGDREMAVVLVAHRAVIYREHVEARLEGGAVVIANRGEPATLAYQTARKEMSLEEVWDMHREMDIRKPGLVVLTICAPDIAADREKRDSSYIRREREGGGGLSGKITRESGLKNNEMLERRRKIHQQYMLAGRFLREKGTPVLTLNTKKMNLDEETRLVLAFTGLDK